MKSFFSRNVLIAITALVSLCLLYWGIDFLKGVNLFTPANFYYAKFDKVNGLVKSAPITVNGFQVGQVREINYDYNNNQISVMLAMNKDLKIPQGSTVSIVSNLTGAATMALTLGDQPTFLNVGDEVPSVTNMGLMDKVGKDVMPQLVAILPKLDSILSNVNALTANPALQASVTRLDGITAELANSSHQLNTLMTSLNRTMPGVMTNVGTITTNFGEASGNLNAMTAKFNQMPIDQTVRDLNATVANLQALSAKLNSKDSSLGMLLNDNGLYNHADQSLAALDSLLVDIRQHPKRYITIKVF